MTTDLESVAKYSELVARLSLEQKVTLLTGSAVFTTTGHEGIGLAPINLSDGPTGVRGPKFLGGRVVSLLPNATLLSASWSTDVTHEVGRMLAEEAQSQDIRVVLGPTINLHRSVLGGRLFEAYSEDPLLTGVLAAAYVDGLQGSGIGDQGPEAEEVTRRGPNEGSIYERWDGRWAGTVSVGYEAGRRVRKHVMGHSRTEVKEKMAVLLRAHEERRPIPDQRTKVGPFLRRWLDEVAKPTLRASTYDSYDDILKGHLIPGLGHVALAKLTPADVQGFLNRKLEGGLSPRRVQYIHAVLRRALVTAERWGMVSRNVAKLVDPPRVPRHEITPLTPEQARVLIETSADDRHRALWVTALATGLRQGELLGLRWDDVDLDSGRLRVRHSLANVKGELTMLEPKTDRSRRTVLLADAVVTALRAHRTRQRMERLVSGSRWTDSGHVFTTLRGTPYHAATITRAFKAALTRAGLPACRFHDLRHAAATFLLAQGMTLEDVKNLLGHSSITLTSNTYGHVLEQRQRQVARAMDAVLGR